MTRNLTEESFTIQIKAEGSVRKFPGDPGKNVLEYLQEHGFSVHAPCGGNGTCGQCRVLMKGTVRTEEESLVTLDFEEECACRVYPAGDLFIEIPEHSGEQVLTDALQIPSGGEGLGLAVDIGTTTVAAYLYDLQSGLCLSSAGKMNDQRTFGADVISRIQYAAKEEGLKTLCRAIRQQIVEMAETLTGDLSKIRYISIAGNTVMEHLFAGLSPVSIGVAPFEPLSLFGEETPASDFFNGFSPDCRLFLAPAVAGYVGGDITAGILSSGACKEEEKVLFIDIGTNGEMALGSKEGFLCCATAAGPAFEGAEIDCGSPARDGAINRVNTDLSFTVLGDVPPASICGSGIIDAVAALLCNELVDETGRMEEESYTLGGDVFISGKDIRQIQLAKAAIRAGMETLLEREKTSYEDISKVLIAGGFGAFMRLESAGAIGLLPPALVKKACHVGNSAGRGAALSLTEEGRKKLKEVQSICRYEELSSSPLFNENYIDAMMFDEWEEIYG